MKVITAPLCYWNGHHLYQNVIKIVLILPSVGKRKYSNYLRYRPPVHSPLLHDSQTSKRL